MVFIMCVRKYFYAHDLSVCNHCIGSICSLSKAYENIVFPSKVVEGCFGTVHRRIDGSGKTARRLAKPSRWARRACLRRKYNVLIYAREKRINLSLTMRTSNRGELERQIEDNFCHHRGALGHAGGHGGMALGAVSAAVSANVDIAYFFNTHGLFFN